LNWLAIVIDIASMRPSEEYRAAAERFSALVKACPPAPGFGEVMLTGEPERKARAGRIKDGVVVSSGTKELVNAAARNLNLPSFFDA
jgi:LDH2 family malate/lactate/ureidoglycolate dehydrogenase